MEKQLEELVQKLNNAFGEKVVSVVLYGSAATGDWQERASDLNVLCVLKTFATKEMKLAHPIFQWWSKQGNLPLVVLTEEELKHSTDCFPMEFHDIQERRRVLAGRDIAANLQIDFSHYRAYVERELRSKQMRLRQKAVELLTQPDRLLTLMMDSISTFCALGRHALILGKHPVKWKKREILEAMSDATGEPLNAAKQLLAIRENGKRPSATEVDQLLNEYLNDTDVIVHFVDSLGE